MRQNDLLLHMSCGPLSSLFSGFNGYCRDCVDLLVGGIDFGKSSFVWNLAALCILMIL